MPGHTLTAEEIQSVVDEFGGEPGSLGLLQDLAFQGPGPTQPPLLTSGGEGAVEESPTIPPEGSILRTPGLAVLPLGNDQGILYEWQTDVLGNAGWQVTNKIISLGADGGSTGASLEAARLNFQIAKEKLELDWARFFREGGEIEEAFALNRRQQDLDEQEFALSETLGLGQLGISKERLALDRQVGLERLSLDRERVALDEAQVGIAQDTLFENIRANKAREVEDRRTRALDAAADAMSAYLRGTELADARRLAASQETRAFLPSAVSPEQQFFAGQEPGGILDIAARNAGLPFAGTEIQHQVVDPGSLVAPPTSSQIGQGLLEGLGALTKLGQR